MKDRLGLCLIIILTFLFGTAALAQNSKYESLTANLSAVRLHYFKSRHRKEDARIDSRLRRHVSHVDSAVR